MPSSHIRHIRRRKPREPASPKGAELGPVLKTIENALRADQAKMIEAE